MSQLIPRHVLAFLSAVPLLLVGCTGLPDGPQSLRFTETPAVTLVTEETPSPPAAAPTPSCSEASGRVEVLTYPGVVVREPIPIRVYLPPCYDIGESRYPAAYLLHGKPYDETHWEALGVFAAADQGIVTGELQPFLLVLPLQPEPIFTNSDGGPWSYEQEMVEGLVPYVDGAFRTNPRPEARAIVGISRGGIWALEIGFRNPDVFGVVGALSPALSMNHPRQAYDPFRIVESSSALPSEIYLAAGDTDWARAETERLSGILAELGWPNQLEILPGAHQDATWEGVQPSVLGFLDSAWKSLAGTDPTLESSVP